MPIMWVDWPRARAHASSRELWCTWPRPIATSGCRRKLRNRHPGKRRSSSRWRAVPPSRISPRRSGAPLSGPTRSFLGSLPTRLPGTRRAIWDTCSLPKARRCWCGVTSCMRHRCRWSAPTSASSSISTAQPRSRPVRTSSLIWRRKGRWWPASTCLSLHSDGCAKKVPASCGCQCRTRPGPDQRSASSQLHQHLSEVLALEQFEKGRGRVLDAVVYGFPPCDLAFVDPSGHLSLELGHEIEIVRDVEPLQPKALAHDEHDVTWPVGQPCGIVLRDHSADRKASKRVGCCECRLQVLTADIFEINIDACGRYMQQGLGQIARNLVVDDVVDTDVLEKGTLGRTACRPYDRVPLELGDLACDRSDGTGRDRNEHHVARFKRCDLEQADPGRQPWHAGNSQECLGRESERIELLQGSGGCVEPLAPAEYGGDEIARVKSRIVGSGNFADRAALQRITELEGRAPAVHGRVGRGDLPDRAPVHLLARPGRRGITRTMGHAVTHIRIHCHPKIFHLNFARCRVGHRHRGEFEIIGIGHADRSGFQTDFTRCDHGRGPSCLCLLSPMVLHLEERGCRRARRFPVDKPLSGSLSWAANRCPSRASG